MTLNVYRPYCKRPISGAAINIALCLALIAVVKLQSLPSAILWFAAIFGVCGLLFLIIAATSPGTSISIDDTTISRSGTILGGLLRFDEIVYAKIERDPDAQNYKQITLCNGEGRTLLIDPRFLNPEVDGMVDLIREKLRQHRIELAEERVTAEQGADVKPH